MPKKVRLLSVVLGILLLITTVVPLTAQDEIIVISLAMPELIGAQINQEVFDRFEAEHPNIQVHRVNEGAFSYGIAGPTQDVEDYLDDVADYVSTADVVAISPARLMPEATRAGYYLDLTPLVTSDPDMSVDDFYAVMYDSYRWDEGFWALPVSTDVTGLVYQPDAFDEAGIEYPQDWWTMDDFENALRALAEYDNNGNVIEPAFVDFSGNPSLLLRSLLGHGFYDDTVIPSVPSYSDPMLEDLVTRWGELQQDGFIGQLTGEDVELTPPMALAPSLFAFDTSQDNESELAVLPGGAMGLYVNGFAISTGTQHPEAAYELIKFLTESPEVANAFIPTIATARRSIADIEISNDMSALLAVPPDIVDAALENGLPVAETRFGAYLNAALNQVARDDVDAQFALQDAEVEGMNRLQTASDRADDVTIIIDTPPVRTELAEGDLSIRFGMDITSLAGIPHRERWDDVIAEFVANDAQVSEVVLETPNPFQGIELVNMSENFDCYYLFSNVVQSANVEHLLSIDPLMASDPNFDVNDYPATLMAQVQRDGQVWAMPLVVQPQVMGYNPDSLDAGGAPHPYHGWTTADFENILRTLKVDPEDPAPFAPLDVTGSYIFSLIASYGGLPIDYRTNPATIDFTDGATVSAIRQVLDLARDGYIEYNSLTDIAYSAIAIDIEDSEIPLFSVLLNEFFFDLSAESSFAMAEFPQGQTYTSLVYDLGAAYISANTTHAEACYRFIGTVSEHPELFTGMPARRSQLSNPQLETAQGSIAVAFYRQLDTLINQPNAVLFPTGFSNNMETIREYLLLYWLFRAFDRYVLDDADLEAELASAEVFTIGFQQCVADLDPYDETDNLFGYFRQYTGCALQIDPTMEGTFLSF